MPQIFIIIHSKVKTKRKVSSPKSQIDIGVSLLDGARMTLQITGRFSRKICVPYDFS